MGTLAQSIYNPLPVEIRPANSADLSSLLEIDGTIESTQYLHIEKTGEDLSLTLKIEPRPLREKLIQSNRIDDDLNFVLRQIITGADEGSALVAEHDGALVAVALSQPRRERNITQLIDIRIDYDFRRQGLATAMLFLIMQMARDQEHRAVYAEARANNSPANQMLLKCGFELSGADLRRHTNHDLIKESATLLWYVPLD